MPGRFLRQAAPAALLVIWPALVAGQIVNLFEDLLPPPDLATRGERPVRLLGPDVGTEFGEVRSWLATYERREPFTTRATGGLGLFTELDRSVSFTNPWRCGAWRAGATVERTRETTAGWIDDRVEGPRLDGRRDRVDVEVWVGRGERWRIRGRAPVWSDGGDDPRRAGGWDIAWTPFAAAGFAYINRTLETQARFHAPVIDDEVDFPLNAALILDELEFRIDPLPFLTVRVSGYDGRGEPATPLRGVDADELQLEGRMRGSRMKAVVEPAPGWELGYAAGVWSVFSEGSLYWGGQRYGRLNVLSCDAADRELSAIWRAREKLAFRLVYASRDLDVFGRGRVESWPFTETAIDLLGVRQVAEAELTAEFTRVSLGAVLTFEAGECAAGWAHHVVHPEGQLDTWIPGPLGIGRTDFVHREIDAETITVDEVRIAGQVDVGPVRLFFDVRQFVAATVDPGPGSSSSGPDEPTVEELPDMGWWGGLFLSAGLGLAF